MRFSSDPDESLVSHWFFWLLRRVGADFIVQSILLVIILLSLANGLAGLMPRLNPAMLFQPLLIGGVLGWFLARSRLQGWQGLILAFMGGLFLFFGWNGGLISPAWEVVIGMNQQSLSQVTGFAMDSRSQAVSWINAWLEIGSGITLFWEHIFAWILNLFQRRASFDPYGTNFFWGMLLWTIGIWTSWEINRHRQPLRAVIPAGVILAVSLAYGGASIESLVSFLGATLILMGWNAISSRQQHWETDRIDYAEELRLDVSLVTVGLTTVLVSLAVVAPLLSVKNLEKFIDHFRPKFQTVEQPIGKSLGLVQRTAQPPPRSAQTGMDARGLPRSHLIGSGPELSLLPVMSVQTGDLPPIPFQSLRSFDVPHYYWRGLSLDQYNGLGWQTSSTQQFTYSAKEAIRTGLDLFVEPGTKIAFQSIPGVRLVYQKITPAVSLNRLVYTAGDILAVDHFYQVIFRVPPDPFTAPVVDQFAATGDINSYQVWSALPEPDETMLRQAGMDYPVWVKERYLLLPKTVPARVLDLARSLTTNQSTPYEKAQAIENYLRKFPYTLDLPTPPEDRDVVDYFLFDLQTGYCDYYASAMVVLARAAGIPARMAIGYAGGSYDFQGALYRITEADAHSWPEIYFPGIGWVGFEPTASYPVIERPKKASVDANKPTGNLPELMFRRKFSMNLLIWLALILGLLLASIGIILVGDQYALHRLNPQKAVIRIYHRLYRRTPGLGVPIDLSNTPVELATRLIERLKHILPGKRLLSWVKLIGEGVTFLAQLYAKEIYSPHPSGESDRLSAINTWVKLRWRLWLLKYHHRKYPEK